MDPNQALEGLRDAARRFLDGLVRADTREMDEAGMQLADGFIALDEWLSRDGALPRAWHSHARNGIAH